ncbi:MAG: trigger factor [Bacteroidetes bacterium]|nr:trigger factor [Bacteroidota bacterium]
MEYKVNDLSLSEKEVEITLAYDEIKNEVETEVKKQTKNIQISGFRKGKVPMHLLKKMYGDALEHEASEKVANNQFWEIAKEKHLHPIGQPSLTDIKFKPGEDLYFKVKYEVYPQLEVKDYTGNEIEIPDFKVKDEEVEAEIKYILKTNSTNEVADIVGEDRNYLLDVEIKRIDGKGELFEGTKPENIQIDLSDDRTQKEIVDNSKGKKVGESFNFSFNNDHIEKDENGNDKVITEPIFYTALIKEIKKIISPELNEELIKKITKDKVSNETDLREDIRKDLQNYYDQRVEDLIQDKLIGLIVKNNEFTPPNTLVSNILEEFVKNEEESSKKQGYKKFDRNEASNRLKKSAEFNVKWFLIKNAIEKKENISITDDELTELATKDAEKTGIAVDKLVNYYKSSNYGEKLLDKKVFDYLKEKNTIKRVDPESLLQKETKE